MEIEKIPALVKQLQDLREILRKRQKDMDDTNLKIFELEGMVGNVPENDGLLLLQIDSYRTVLQSQQLINRTQEQQIDKVQRSIETAAAPLLSRAWYDQVLDINTYDSRRLWTPLRDKAYDLLCLRVEMLGERMLPSMVIHPHDLRIIDVLAPHSATIYVADESDYMLNESKKRLDSVGHASSMIRTYNTGPAADTDLRTLPVGQLALIVCWYLPQVFTLPMIDDLLRRCSDLMRPGAHIILGINDCQTVQAATLASPPVVRSYMTRELLEPVVQKNGMEIRSWESVDTETVMVAIAMPGELTKIKAKASTGIIKRY
jgi:hypothetical protein